MNTALRLAATLLALYPLSAFAADPVSPALYAFENGLGFGTDAEEAKGLDADAALRKSNFSGSIALQCFGIKGDKKANLETSIDAWKAISLPER